MVTKIRIFRKYFDQNRDFWKILTKIEISKKCGQNGDFFLNIDEIDSFDQNRDFRKYWHI